MSSPIYELLRQNVKKMVHSFDRNEQGNIYPLILQEVERYLIEVVLEETKYNYVRAAQALGISRSKLYRRITALGIKTKEEPNKPHL